MDNYIYYVAFLMKIKFVLINNEYSNTCIYDVAVFTSDKQLKYELESTQIHTK
jgi:hypothetical protein